MVYGTGGIPTWGDAGTLDFYTGVLIVYSVARFSDGTGFGTSST
jgi:hypothetical protein